MEIYKNAKHHYFDNRYNKTLDNSMLHVSDTYKLHFSRNNIQKKEERHHITKDSIDMKQKNNNADMFSSISEVNIKLDPSTIAEIQWIGEPETGLMIQGNARITVIDEHGDARVADLKVGDMWDFEQGYRYSINILDSGCVFKLYLKNCNLDENKTHGYQIDGSLYIKL